MKRRINNRHPWWVIEDEYRALYRIENVSYRSDGRGRIIVHDFTTGAQGEAFAIPRNWQIVDLLP